MFLLLSVLVEPKRCLEKGTFVQLWQKGSWQFSEASFIQEGFCIKFTREHGCLNANTHVKIGILHHSAGKQVQHRRFLPSTNHPSGISVKGLSIQGFRGNKFKLPKWPEFKVDWLNCIKSLCRSSCSELKWSEIRLIKANLILKLTTYVRFNTF